MIKRSVKISGHNTSVSLEDEFWVALKEISDIRSLSINKLIEEIERSRPPHYNLSSAIRVYILNQLKTNERVSY
jgi:predicted DNA-binding ribbon-helix-helix protein